MQIKWLTVSALVLSLGAATACGGDDDDDSPQGGGGSSGSGASGGKSGGSGSSGAAGSSGSSGATGGKSGNGSGGSGMVPGGMIPGGMGLPPGLADRPEDPLLKARCEAECNRYAEAMCEDPDDCSEECAVFARLSGCAADLDSFLDCSESKAPICDDEGEATVRGCEEQQASAAACLITELADPAYIPKCETLCDKQEAAMCSAEETPPNCAVGCAVMPTLFPACAAAYDAVLTCSGTATLTCDDEGEAQVEGCDPESQAFVFCLFSAIQSSE
jgi:hypothetical protein